MVHPVQALHDDDFFAEDDMGGVGVWGAGVAPRADIMGALFLCRVVQMKGELNILPG